LTFQFEDFVLDPDRRELRRAGTLVAVEPQVFDLINYLVCNRDRVVTRDNLLDAIWNGRVVSESTLASRINAARRALNDSGGEQRLIRTVARKGVRFVGRVEGSRPAEASSSPVPKNADATMRSPLPLPDRPAIAVLPFTNLSGETEQEYFSDGISEDIIMALSKLRWFFVIARNSSFTYKGKAVHMNQIARSSESAMSSKAAYARAAIAFASLPSSMTWLRAATSGRSATTARSPMSSPCRTSARKTSSPRSSRNFMPPKAFAPSASRPTAWMPGIW
jgi:DNA-binding winged helix-turn-helix (wHTH) protein